MSVITEFGCIPVTTNYKTKEFGWVGTNYFNNVIGITNPDLLEPPTFCADAVMDVEAEPRDYLGLLVKKN
nr:ependymin-1 precursor [Oryzias melastigma]